MRLSKRLAVVLFCSAVALTVAPAGAFHAQPVYGCPYGFGRITWHGADKTYRQYELNHNGWLCEKYDFTIDPVTYTAVDDIRIG